MAVTVTMPLTELDELRNSLRTANEAVAALQQQIRTLKEDGIPIEAAILVEGLRAAHIVICYAIANLDPEFARRWPEGALATYMRAYETMPEADREWIIDTKNFLERITEYEVRRRATDRWTAAPARHSGGFGIEGAPDVDPDDPQAA